MDVKPLFLVLDLDYKRLNLFVCFVLCFLSQGERKPVKTQIVFNHSWLKCCLTSTETVGLLGTGAQDVHLDFHTAPELWFNHRDN